MPPSTALTVRMLTVMPKILPVVGLCLIGLGALVLVWIMCQRRCKFSYLTFAADVAEEEGDSPLNEETGHS